MKNFGILLRGKSLEKVNLIIDKFDDCILVNNFKVELNKYVKDLKGKNIVHFANAMPSAGLEKQQYKLLNIRKIQFSFTKKYRENYHSKQRIDGVIKHYNNLKIGLKLEYTTDRLYEQIFNIHNTGIAGVLYVSECIKSKNIWIAGLDFYQTNYLVKSTTSKQQEKSKKIDMTGSFISIVKNHPDIKYNVISYYNDFPNLENLNIIKF